MDCLRGPQHGNGGRVSKDYDSALLRPPSQSARGGGLSPLSSTDANRAPSRGAEGSSGPAEQQKAAGSSLLPPCALSALGREKPRQVPQELLAANSGKHSLFSGPRRLAASFLGLLCDVT